MVEWQNTVVDCMARLFVARYSDLVARHSGWLCGKTDFFVCDKTNNCLNDRHSLCRDLIILEHTYTMILIYGQIYSEGF